MSLAPPLFNEALLGSDCKFVSLQGHLLPCQSPTLSSPISERSSCSFTRRPPTIRFAPLPKVDATRKRSVPPLGVSGRSRRKCIPQEGRSCLWAVDPIPEEKVEDPILILGRLVKKAGRRMWKKMRMRGAMAMPQEKDYLYTGDVIDIRPDEISGDTSVSSDGTEGDESGLVDEDDLQRKRASWSTVRGPPDNRKLQVRRSTGDLATFSRASL